MKKNLLWMMAAILTCGLMLTACSKSDDAPADDGNKTTPAAEKDITIIYYGNGGANLDHFILYNMYQMYTADASSYDKMNIVVQYKNSQNIKNETQTISLIENEMLPGFKFEKGTTYRYAVDPKKGYSAQNPRMQFTDDNIYGGKGNTVDIGQADTLCNYIKWAVKNYPAKQYVLIFADHGGGYMPNDDLPESLTQETAPKTRGLVYDDGYRSTYGDSHLSVSGLARAIRESGIKPSLIYFDACLMNGMEYLFELKDLTSYVMASTYLTPGKGGTYASFINALASKGVTTEAFEQYYDALRKYWSTRYDPQVPEYNDNTVTRTDRLDAAGTALRAFVDCLIDVYQNGSDTERAQIDAITSKVYKVASSNPYYDIENFLYRMSNGEQSNAKLTAAADAALEAIRSADAENTGTQYTYDNYLPGRSVLMGHEGQWCYLDYDEDEDGNDVLDGKLFFSWDGSTTMYSWNNTTKQFEFKASGNWGSTGAATYEQLQFDKATGWSRWLKLNKQEPNLTSPTTFNDKWDDSYIYDPEL